MIGELVSGLVSLVGGAISQAQEIARAAGAEDAFLAAMRAHLAEHFDRAERAIAEKHGDRHP